MPPSFLRLSAKRDLLYHVLVLMDLVQLKVRSIQHTSQSTLRQAVPCMLPDVR